MSEFIQDYRLPFAAISYLRQRGHQKCYVISDETENNFYIFGVTDRYGGFMRIRFKANKDKDVYFTSDLLPFFLTLEECDNLIEKIGDRIMVALEKANEESKLHHEISQENFWTIPKNKELIDELDKIIESYGKKLDEIYQMRKADLLSR